MQACVHDLFRKPGSIFPGNALVFAPTGGGRPVILCRTARSNARYDDPGAAAVLTIRPFELPNQTSPTEQSEPVRDVRAELRPWGFWASLGWGLFTFATTLLAAFIYLAIRSRIHQVTILSALREDFTVVEIGLSVVPVVVLAIAVKCRHYSLRDYFALNGIPRRDLALGIAGLIAIAIFEAIEWLLGIDEGSASVATSYRTSELAGMLPALWLAIVIAAPVNEELLFRGFLHRGWTSSRLGVSGTIILTSALWTAMHVQYYGFGLLGVFATGLLLGWIRQRSASTTLTIVLHALNNLVAMIVLTVQIQWSS
jgi:membrane protease YdiL (CAAX protease family)